MESAALSLSFMRDLVRDSRERIRAEGRGPCTSLMPRVPSQDSQNGHSSPFQGSGASTSKTLSLPPMWGREEACQGMAATDEPLGCGHGAMTAQTEMRDLQHGAALSVACSSFLFCSSPSRRPKKRDRVGRGAVLHLILHHAGSLR